MTPSGSFYENVHSDCDDSDQDNGENNNSTTNQQGPWIGQAETAASNLAHSIRLFFDSNSEDDEETDDYENILGLSDDFSGDDILREYRGTGQDDPANPAPVIGEREGTIPDDDVDDNDEDGTVDSSIIMAAKETLWRLSAVLGGDFLFEASSPSSIGNGQSFDATAVDDNDEDNTTTNNGNDLSVIIDV